jgi:hypothetical protein
MVRGHAGADVDGPSVAGWRDAGEQLGIFGELGDVFEREAGGARPVAGDDERGDLDELALTTCGRTTSLLGARDVAGRGDVVAATRSQHGEEGVLDGEVGHGVSVRGGADAWLTSH